MHEARDELRRDHPKRRDTPLTLPFFSVVSLAAAAGACSAMASRFPWHPSASALVEPRHANTLEDQRRKVHGVISSLEARPFAISSSSRGRSSASVAPLVTVLNTSSSARRRSRASSCLADDIPAGGVRLVAEQCEQVLGVLDGRDVHDDAQVLRRPAACARVSC